MDRLKEQITRLKTIAAKVREEVLPLHKTVWGEGNSYGGIKFVSTTQIDKHIARALEYIDCLGLNSKKKSSIFEIGPGTCYMLYFLQEQGHEVAGVDLYKADTQKALLNSEVFKYMRERLCLDKVVTTATPIRAQIKMNLGRKYDYIIATWITFAREWTLKDHTYWLKDCYNYLNKHGKIFLSFNAATLWANKSKPEVYDPELAGELIAFYRSIGAVNDTKKNRIEVLIGKESIRDVIGT